MRAQGYRLGISNPLAVTNRYALFNGMNYELAKQLKDARFPNPLHGNHFDHHLWGRNFIAPDGNAPIHEKGRQLNHDDFFFPTLSELIEACGKDFGLLERNTNDVNISSVWTANDWDTEGEDYYGLGSTPEEAVAYLWLALHK